MYYDIHTVYQLHSVYIDKSSFITHSYRTCSTCSTN